MAVTDLITGLSDCEESFVYNSTVVIVVISILSFSGISVDFPAEMHYNEQQHPKQQEQQQQQTHRETDLPTEQR